MLGTPRVCLSRRRNQKTPDLPQLRPRVIYIGPAPSAAGSRALLAINFHHNHFGFAFRSLVPLCGAAVYPAHKQAQRRGCGDEAQRQQHSHPAAASSRGNLRGVASCLNLTALTIPSKSLCGFLCRNPLLGMRSCLCPAEFSRSGLMHVDGRTEHANRLTPPLSYMLRNTTDIFLVPSWCNTGKKQLPYCRRCLHSSCPHHAGSHLRLASLTHKHFKHTSK